MVEYIKREAAIESIMSEPPDSHYPQWYADKIKAIPAADVAPVRHGEWVCGDYYDVGNVCSECDWDSQMICPSYRYCPNCGAKMDCKQ